MEKFEKFKITKIILQMMYMLPYVYLVWLGTPYRYSRIYNIFEHYFGRFISFMAILFFGMLILLVIFTNKTLFLTMIIIVLSLIAVFDIIIMGCRALFVYEAVKRVPEGGNALAVWNDKSLWEDD